MATFAYKVMDAKGTPATGQVDGDSKVVAAAALRSRGLTVLDLDEVKRGLARSTSWSRSRPSRPGTSLSSRASSPPW